MEIFGKRYFIWISGAFLVFSALGLTLDIVAVAQIFCVLFALLSAFLIFLKKKPKGYILIAALILIFSLIGAGNSVLYASGMNDISDRYVGERTVRGYVTDVSYNEIYLSEYVVAVEEVDGEDVSFSAVLVTEYGGGLSLGDFFEATLLGVDFEEYNEGRFLSNSYSSDYALVFLSKEEGDIVSLESEFRLPLSLANLKTELSDILEKNIDGISGKMASALLLGNRNLLPDESLRDFRRAGCYHMLALSGMHVSIIVAIFEFLLKKLYVPKGIRIVILSALLIFYVALTGFLPSACRAMLMLWIYYLATVLGRTSDPLVALFGAVSVIVLISPSSALDLGLTLSFLSTFGVIIASMLKSKIKFFNTEINGKSFKRRAVSLVRNCVFMLMATLCACVASLPVLQMFFGELSLATFFTNLFIGVLAEILLALSLIVILLFYIGLPFGFVADAAGFIGDVMSGAVAWISDMPHVVLSLDYPAMPILVWTLFISSLTLLSLKLKRKLLLAIPPVCFGLLVLVSVISVFVSRVDKLDAEFISSDRGDSVCLTSNGGFYICDMSDGSYSALYDALELSRENYFSEIEGVVLTHYHKDHCVSLDKLCSKQTVRKLYLPIPQNEDEYSVLINIFYKLREGKTELVLYEREETLDILGGELFVSRAVLADGRAHPSVALSYCVGEQRMTVLENPYFSTYLEENEELDRLISLSGLLILGGDGNAPKESFAIAEKTENVREICFALRESVLLSDLDVSEGNVYVDVKYKKYSFGEN